MLKLSVYLSLQIYYLKVIKWKCRPTYRTTMSIEAKFGHYDTVTKLEGLYVSETLTISNRRQVDQLEKRECRILIKTLDNGCAGKIDI